MKKIFGTITLTYYMFATNEVVKTAIQFKNLVQNVQINLDKTKKKGTDLINFGCPVHCL